MKLPYRQAFFLPLECCFLGVQYGVFLEFLEVLRVCFGCVNLLWVNTWQRSYSFDGLSFNFWYMVFPAEFWLQGYTKVYGHGCSMNYVSFTKPYAGCIVYVSFSTYVDKLVLWKANFWSVFGPPVLARLVMDLGWFLSITSGRSTRGNKGYIVNETLGF